MKMTAENGLLDLDRLRWAAREKLAFGLAHLLKLPVPPVVLWDGGELEERRYLAISAAFWPFTHWPTAEHRMSDSDKEKPRAIFSAMHVFDTWIAGTNRSEAHALIHEPSLEKGHLRMAFIDHASSMAFHRSSPWPAKVMEYCLPRIPDEDAMRRTAGDMAALDAAQIANLLDRIPVAYFPDERERTEILLELTRRKDGLLTMLELGT